MTLCVQAAEGALTSVIVVPVAPNGVATFAAKELRWHLKKIAGANVPIINDREKVEAGKVQIMVGEIRLSNVVRKPALQKELYATDKNRFLLLHFDEEPGQPATDASKEKP